MAKHIVEFILYGIIGVTLYALLHYNIVTEKFLLIVGLSMLSAKQMMHEIIYHDNKPNRSHPEPVEGQTPNPNNPNEQ